MDETKARKRVSTSERPALQTGGSVVISSVAQVSFVVFFSVATFFAAAFSAVAPSHGQDVTGSEEGPIPQDVSPDGAADPLDAVPESVEPRDQPAGPAVDGSEEPEVMLFDLYLGDTLRGGILLNYTDTWFEIDSPRDIFEQLAEVKDGERFATTLTGRIEKSRAVPGLGTVSFDPYTFRLIITPEATALQGSSIDLSAQLASPEAAPSLLQSFGLSAAGDPSDELRTSFTHRTTAGFSRYFLIYDGTHIQDAPYEVNEAVGTAYYDGQEVRAGLEETRGQSFATSSQYLGVSVETSEGLLLNQDLGKGSKVEVFIPSHARVEFYRGSRLLTVQFLSFGLQEIDTSSFPQGSYDVDIIIREDNGRTTTQRRFFTKAGYLTSRAAPTYRFALGAERDEFQVESEPIYQAGISWRALDSLELDGSAYGDNNLSVGQIGAESLFGDLHLRGGFAYSSNGDYGAMGAATYQLFGTTMDISGTDTLRLSDKSARAILENEAPLDETDDAAFPFPDRRRRTKGVVFRDVSSLSASIQRTFGPFNFRYFATRDESEGLRVRRARGPSLEYAAFSASDVTVRLVTEWLSTERGRERSGAVRTRYLLSPNLSLNSDLSYINREEEDEAVLYTFLTYDLKTPAGRGARVTFTNELRHEKDKTDDDASENSVINGIGVDHAGDYVRTVASVRNKQGKSSEESDVGVNASSAFLVGGDGTTSISAPPERGAVFIANLESKSTTSEFNLVIDGQAQEKCAAGKRTAIGLSPYRTYKISIRPTEDADLVDYDPQVFTVTVLPGNVVSRTWKVEKVHIILGRVIDEEGKPVAFERIRGTREYIATDNDGVFQAEITGNETLSIEGKKRSCRLDLSARSAKTPPASEFFEDLGDIVCRPIIASDKNS